MVKLAKRKTDGEIVAVKIVEKKNLKQIEVYQ